MHDHSRGRGAGGWGGGVGGGGGGGVAREVGGIDEVGAWGEVDFL